MLWLLGIAMMIIYSMMSLIKLRRKLVGAICLRDNIYLADYIPTPFVIGLFRPRIYLPSTISKQEQSYIILHEQMHIRRLDHLVKMIAFIALTVHWFNPLAWVELSKLEPEHIIEKYFTSLNEKNT
jgi:bla regulator protein BlaR1